jgi:hypothetical protein
MAASKAAADKDAEAAELARLSSRWHDLYARSLEHRDAKTGKAMPGVADALSASSPVVLNVINQIASVNQLIFHMRSRLLIDRPSADSISAAFFKPTTPELHTSQAGSEVHKSQAGSEVHGSQAGFFVRMSHSEPGLIHALLSDPDLTPWVHTGDMPAADFTLFMDGQPLYAMERKTISDLQERYLDWKSQRLRMIDVYLHHPMRPVPQGALGLMLEHSSIDATKMSLGTIMGILACDQLAYGIHTTATSDVLQSVLVILSLTWAALRYGVSVADGRPCYVGMEQDLAIALMSESAAAKTALRKATAAAVEGKIKGRPSSYSTAKLTFSKQLNLLDGVTAEMAIAIVDRWPSPDSLRTALRYERRLRLPDYQSKLARAAKRTTKTTKIADAPLGDGDGKAERKRKRAPALPPCGETLLEGLVYTRRVTSTDIRRRFRKEASVHPPAAAAPDSEIAELEAACDKIYTKRARTDEAGTAVGTALPTAATESAASGGKRVAGKAKKAPLGPNEKRIGKVVARRIAEFYVGAPSDEPRDDRRHSHSKRERDRD